MMSEYICIEIRLTFICMFMIYIYFGNLVIYKRNPHKEKNNKFISAISFKNLYILIYYEEDFFQQKNFCSGNKNLFKTEYIRNGTFFDQIGTIFNILGL